MEPVATNVIAINRQMMFDGAFQRLAEVHEALGDDPARVARYDAIARASIRECLDGMKNPFQVAGHTAYRWYYFPDRTHGIEATCHGKSRPAPSTRTQPRRHRRTTALPPRPRLPPRTNGCACALGAAAASARFTTVTLLPAILALLAVPWRRRSHVPQAPAVALRASRTT